MHSTLLPDILVKENNYAKIIAGMNARMENEISILTSDQQKEMDKKIKQLDVSTTEFVTIYLQICSKRYYLICMHVFRT